MTAGKVEMYHHGNWVTMCAKGFDKKDAKVVCKELGFPNSKDLVPGKCKASRNDEKTARR